MSVAAGAGMVFAVEGSGRLKRGGGHLQKVIGMIEASAGCLEFAQQLQAVCKALEGAKSTFIHDHIEHCLDNLMVDGGALNRGDLKEFKDIATYLER